MSGFQLSFPEPFSTQLHGMFKGNSENFIFCFHSISPTLVFSDQSFVKGHTMIFGQNYSKTIPLKDFSGKYTNGCHVIFQSLDVTKSRPFLVTFWSILFYIRLVLVYLSSRPKLAYDTLSPRQLNMPLLKLAIYPGKIRDTNSFYIEVLCNNYCIQRSETQPANIIRKAINDPIGTHRIYFWNANRKIIQAAVFAKFWTYFEPEVYGNDRFACSRLVMKTIDMLYCSYDIMGFITLAEINNISIVPYSKMKTSEAS